MAKKIRKPAPIKTRNFIITSVSENATETFGKAWEIRYSKNKKMPERDTVSVLGTVTYSDGDLYHCSEAVIEAFAELTADEWKEILETVNPAMAAYETVEFVRFEKNSLPAPLLSAAEALKLVSDITDGDYLLWEQPVTNYGPIYMLFGMSIGMSFGINTNMSVGMSMGMAIGLAIGSGLTANAKKAREALKAARTNGIEPPIKK